MLKMVDLLLKYCRVEEMKLCYTDTGLCSNFIHQNKKILDSYHFATAMPLIDLAKPEYDYVWRNEIFPQTFVTDEMTADASPDEKLRIAKRMREPG